MSKLILNPNINDFIYNGSNNLELYYNGSILWPPVYQVTCMATNGTVTASPTSGRTGSTVTLTATPNSGYEFQSYTITGTGASISGNTLTIGTSNVSVVGNFRKPMAFQYFMFKFTGNQGGKGTDYGIIQIGGLCINNTYSFTYDRSNPSGGFVSSEGPAKCIDGNNLSTKWQSPKNWQNSGSTGYIMFHSSSAFVPTSWKFGTGGDGGDGHKNPGKPYYLYGRKTATTSTAASDWYLLYTGTTNLQSNTSTWSAAMTCTKYYE